MAEKINIFELDIDTDAVLKRSKDLKTTLDDVTSSLKILKDNNDTSSESYVKLAATQKSLRSEYNSSQTQLSKLISLQGKEIKSVEQGRNALSVINKEWAKQAELYGVNSQEADDLAKKKLELTERLKELEKATGDNTRNVGNYTESMKDAIGQSTLLGRAIGGVKDVQQAAIPVYKSIKSEFSGVVNGYRAGVVQAKAYSGAQKAAALGTNLLSAALKLFKIALISTGIGAIIVLIGSLVAWFSKTQAGIDFVNKALAGLGAAFDVIIDRLSKVGGALVKLFSGDFSGAFDDIKEAASGLGDELVREIALALKLEQVLQDVAKAEVNLDIRRSAANTRLKELNKSVEDLSKTTEERIKAAQEFARIEESLVAEEVSNQEKRVAAMLGFAEVTDEVREKIKQIGQEGVSLDELGLSESTLEDAKEFRDEITKLFDVQTRSFEVQTTNQNKLNTLINEEKRKREEAAKVAQAAAQKATDDAIKENKVKLQLFIEQSKGQAKSLDEQLKQTEAVRDKRLVILEQEVEAGKLTQTEAELERLKIKNDFLEQQKDLVVDFAQQEIEIYKQNHQSRIEQGQLLNDSLVALEVQRLESIAEREREFQQKRLEEGVISQQEYNAAIDAIDAESKANRDAIQAEYKQQQDEAKILDQENQRILDEENLQYDLDLQLQYLELEKQRELKLAEEKGADLSKINDKYAQIEKQINEAVQTSKLQLASDTFGNLATIAGKESVAGKAFAVAQTTIDTYQSATAAYKAMAGIPVVGPVLGGIAAAAAVASGIANVRKITSTKTPKAEQGALFDIGGNRHYAGGTKFYGEDGTQFEAEQGELIGVMNRRAAVAFKSFNDEYANTTSSKNYLAGGGFVQTASLRNVPSFTNSSTQIDYGILAKAIGMEVAQANRELPAPITDVKDIISGVNNYNSVIDGANI